MTKFRNKFVWNLATPFAESLVDTIQFHISFSPTFDKISAGPYFVNEAVNCVDYDFKN
jgi:hypothetical protein